MAGQSPAQRFMGRPAGLALFAALILGWTISHALTGFDWVEAALVAISVLMLGLAVRHTWQKSRPRRTGS